MLIGASPIPKAPGMNLLAQYGTSNKIATLQKSKVPNTGPMPTPTLPSWLSTDPNSLLDEIMAEYNGSGKRFDTAGIARGYDASINTAMGMGGQIADNAAREAIARAGQSGGSINSAMVKAQSMLPVYEHTAGLRKDKALAIADVKSREATMRAGLAQALGSMRTAYLSMLADSYFRAQGLSNQWAQGQEQFGLQREEFDLRKELAMRASSAGDGGGRMTQPFQGQISRAPNNSGMGNAEFTPAFREYLDSNGGGSADAPPRYPSASGVQSGGALDDYERMWRGIAGDATGTPDWNNILRDFAGSFDGGYYGDPNYEPMTGLYRGKPVIRTGV